MGFPRQAHWRGLPIPSPGFFLTQISNQHLTLGRRILYHWTIWEAYFSVSTPCIPFKSVVKSLPNSLWEFREWRKRLKFLKNFYWSIADLQHCVTFIFFTLGILIGIKFTLYQLGTFEMFISLYRHKHTFLYSVIYIFTMLSFYQ